MLHKEPYSAIQRQMLGSSPISRVSSGSLLFPLSTQLHVQVGSLLKTGRKLESYEKWDRCGGSGVWSCNFRKNEMDVSLFSFFPLLSFLSVWLVVRLWRELQPGKLKGAGVELRGKEASCRQGRQALPSHFLAAWSWL